MIRTRIKGQNVGLVISRVAGLPEAVSKAGAIGLARGLVYVVGISQREFLQGPRPEKLGERTTRLRQSIVSKVEQTGERVIGTIGSNVSYAAFHEFGFHGVENVRAHSRVIGVLNEQGQPVDNRRMLKDRAGQVIGFRESRGRAAGRIPGVRLITQQVKAHSRRVDYKGRPFVRPALLKGLPVIRGEIKRELDAIK